MSRHTRGSLRPAATEFVVVAAVLVVLYLWQRLLRLASSVAFGSLPVAGGVSGALFLAGVVAIIGGYARVRHVDCGLRPPTAGDLPWIGVAAGSPLGLVTLTALVSRATGVRYGSLTGTAVAADPPLVPVVTVAGLGLLVGIPSLVVVCQVLVQGSFARVVDGDAVVVPTTAVTGFVTVSDTGGLAAIPGLGRLGGVVVFAVLLGGAALANERIDPHRRGLRVLAYLPVAALVALAVGSGVAGLGSVAAGLFAATQFVTLGVAAYAYARTGSLLVPAFAYAALLSANRVVVVAFEAGAGL
ncbi:hypothetical protein [Haloplanus salilacus]|uniref:hypothetical protein n=1 Tax=Haloplanus salilacus TaxID=2949994 RepID=UPI0030CF334A